MDRADSEPEPRCTVGGWVMIRGRPTMVTELFRVDSVLSFIRIEGDLTLPHSPMADTPITSVTFTASLRHPKSTFNHCCHRDMHGTWEIDV